MEGRSSPWGCSFPILPMHYSGRWAVKTIHVLCSHPETLFKGGGVGPPALVPSKIPQVNPLCNKNWQLCLPGPSSANLHPLAGAQLTTRTRTLGPWCPQWIRDNIRVYVDFYLKLGGVNFTNIYCMAWHRGPGLILLSDDHVTCPLGSMDSTRREGRTANRGQLTLGMLRITF